MLHLEQSKIERLAGMCDRLVIWGLAILAVGIAFADVLEIFFYGGQVLAAAALLVRIALCERRGFWLLIAAEFFATVVIVSILGATRAGGAFFKTPLVFLEQFGALLIIWLIALQTRLGETAEDEATFSLYRLVQLAFAGFVLVSLLSAVLSLSPEVSFRDLRKELGPYAIIYLVVVRSAKNMDSLKKIVRILFAVGLIVACVGIGEYAVYRVADYRVKRYFLRSDIVRAEEPGQVQSPVRIQFPFGHHNRMASYMMLITMILLIQTTLTVKGSNQRWTVAAMVLPLGAMALTWNRGAIIGLVAGLLVFALFTRWRYILYGALVLLLGYVLVPSVMKSHFATIASSNLYTGDEGTVALRKYGWRAAMQMVADYPFLGIGYGWRNFQKVYPKYRDPADTENKPHSHNNFLEIAAENGLIGLGLFVLFSMLLVWESVRRCLAQQSASQLRLTAAAFLGTLIAIHTFGLSNYSLRRTIGFLIWMLFGLVLAYLRLYGKGYSGKDECATERPPSEGERSSVGSVAMLEDR
jgi:hypothetical protein